MNQTRSSKKKKTKKTKKIKTTKKKKPQLVKSVSGIRGVIGNGLDSVLATTYGAAFGTMLGQGPVVLGADTRTSGPMICRAVKAGLASVGVDVIDLGIVPTPTVEIAVKGLKATGGICVTASHNGAAWNALKFFSSTGEFITVAQFKKLEKIVASGKFSLEPTEKIGQVKTDSSWIDKHIQKTLAQKVVNLRAVRKHRFKLVVDAINGAGSDALPNLLEKMGATVIRINCQADGNFVHEPEPVPANLTQLSKAVRKQKADLGLACDPDADRLALVDENGRPIGEELTLTIAVRQVLKRMKGPTVINLSTSRVTADIAKAVGSRVYRSKVGEANVVAMMHQKKAVIGGEGNGGVMFPSFHTGRDALIGAALVLSCLAEEKISLSALVATFPAYFTAKSKGSLTGGALEKRLARFEKTADKLIGRHRVDRRDGLRFDFEAGWLQIRASNTEPIFRLVVETNNKRLTGKLHQALRRYFR